MKWKKERLKPSQPYFVLETEAFQQEIFRHQGISHFYTFSKTSDAPIAAVPDGCVDILFHYVDSQEMKAYACGTALKYQKVGWMNRGEVFGVRFLPGFKPAGMAVSLKSLTDCQLPLAECFPEERFFIELSKRKGFKERIKAFIKVYRQLEYGETALTGKRALVFTVKNYVYHADGLIKISQLSRLTGYSERYINKVFIEEMGLSPKHFCKIIQFQRGLEFMNYGAPDKMTDAAVDLGYYDQSQFIRDFKVYAGITPYQYLKKIRQKSYGDKVHSTAYL